MNRENCLAKFEMYKGIHDPTHHFIGQFPSDPDDVPGVL